jgi:inosose dehydratase
MQTRKLSIFFEHILEAQEQTGLSLSNILDQIKRWGYEGIEINLDYAVQNPDTIMLLRQKGFRFSCIYQFYDWEKSTDLTKAKLHVDTAVRLSAGKILVVPGFFNDKETELFHNLHKKDEIYKMMDSLDSVKNITSMLWQTVQYAQEKHITVTLEDFDSANSPCAKTYQLLYFFERIKGLKFTMDCGNFAYSDEDAAEAFNQLKEYMAHIHLKDRGRESCLPEGLHYNKGLAPVPTGSGYIPIARFVEEAEAMGYKDYFAIEHFGSPDQLTFMQKSAAFMESF